MREILFRGKVIGRNQWVYGHYFVSPLTDENSGEPPQSGWCFLSGIGCKPHHIIVQNSVAFSVDPDTVGQYTGLNDKNGTRIFEGDIVECYDYGGVKLCVSVVEYYGGGFAPFAFPNWEEDKTPEKSKIIGNIFDNPDIIEHE